MKKWLSAIILGTVLVLAACGDNSSKSGETSPEETIYKHNCASCHGQDLSGVSAPGLSDIGSKYSAEEIATIIEEGKGTMPAIKKVNEEDRILLSEWLADKK